ncbi:MAG TPA: histidine phosphatase family protein, partial [Gaiellaceae bacterium]|nr:histidine phosphatase family protein [Gaiellaceae bacterium]
MTTILLARHGETEWNRDGRFQGHADPPLNETGRAQAGELAAELADVELAAVYTSSLRRARETAEVVGAARG